MALDRLIALIFLAVSIAYGYESFVTIEAGLLPFERHETFLPNSLPKVLTVISIGLCMFILVFNEDEDAQDKKPEIDLRHWRNYHFGQAALLLSGMVAYAFALRPLGFLISTIVFIVGSAFILGERRWLLMLLSAGIGTGVIWWLVQVVLGIFLRPWPGFITGG